MQLTAHLYRYVYMLNVLICIRGCLVGREHMHVAFRWKCGKLCLSSWKKKWYPLNGKSHSSAAIAFSTYLSQLLDTPKMYRINQINKTQLFFFLLFHRVKQFFHLFHILNWSTTEWAKRFSSSLCIIIFFLSFFHNIFQWLNKYKCKKILSYKIISKICGGYEEGCIGVFKMTWYFPSFFVVVVFFFLVQVFSAQILHACCRIVYLNTENSLEISNKCYIRSKIIMT